MSIFKDFEIKAIRLLASSVLSSQHLEALVREGDFIGYEYTGNGYFLSVSHASLPTERIVCHKPIVIGSIEGIACGFIIFIENGQLTIECHSWGDVEIPEWFRDRDVQVTATKNDMHSILP